jgi:hypothetical protein
MLLRDFTSIYGITVDIACKNQLRRNPGTVDKNTVTIFIVFLITEKLVTFEYRSNKIWVDNVKISKDSAESVVVKRIKD